MKYGDNWEKILTFLNGFTIEEVTGHFQKKLSKVLHGKWTFRQNMELLVLIEYYGYGKWAPISKAMKIKS